MKRVIHIFNNLAVVYTLSILIVIILHIHSDVKLVEVTSLINLFIIAVSTQIVSQIMEFVKIEPAWLHMFVELLLIEASIFIIEYFSNKMDFTSIYNIILNAILIAGIYTITVIYYTLATKLTADEINSYLEKKKNI